MTSEKKEIILVPVRVKRPFDIGRYEVERQALVPHDVEFVECLINGPEILNMASKAKALYVRGVHIDRTIIEKLDNCAVIALASVGVEYVDVETATQKGIPVTNCPDTFTEEVADHALALMLAAHKRVLEQDRMVREGRWQQGRAQLMQIPRLFGQSLGLLGFGRVARAVCRRALPFGLKVMAYDPYVSETEIISAGAEPVSHEEVLTRSDFLSLHLPKSEKTKNLIGENALKIMKKTSVLVNTGRGSTVDEDALVSALRRGWIAGAALDVFQQEPLDTSCQLIDLPNVILSPHVASASTRFEPARKRRVGHEIGLIFNGMYPMSCANPDVLPRSGLRQWH
ncbi:MAG: C-terminal binding protein [Planctomycetaceae bacterium]|nr:C-terminal binding protein [Planctomycetaceae bacterium]